MRRSHLGPKFWANYLTRRCAVSSSVFSQGKWGNVYKLAPGISQANTARLVSFLSSTKWAKNNPQLYLEFNVGSADEDNTRRDDRTGKVRDKEGPSRFDEILSSMSSFNFHDFRSPLSPASLHLSSRISPPLGFSSAHLALRSHLFRAL